MMFESWLRLRGVLRTVVVHRTVYLIGMGKSGQLFGVMETATVSERDGMGFEMCSEHEADVSKG
jgi:hypothetical protein